MSQCKDCRWWGLGHIKDKSKVIRIDPRTEWQYCHRTSQPDSLLMVESEDGSGCLATYPTFGCVEFHQREQGVPDERPA